MKITPSPLSAALAGAFSALVWPILWSRLDSPTSAGSIELVMATLLVIALPAHACVVGFGRSGAPAARTLDTALLRRIGAWLAGAAVMVLLGMAIRA